MIRMDGVLGGYIVECNLCGMTTGVAFSTDEAAMEYANDEGWSASEDGSETWCPDCVGVGESGESRSVHTFRFKCFYCKTGLQIQALDAEKAMDRARDLGWEVDAGVIRDGIVCHACCIKLQVMNITGKTKKCPRCNHNPATDHLRIREEIGRLQERFDTMTKAKEKAEGELRAIDAVLERRAALDGMVTREAKVGKAIAVAKLADKAIADYRKAMLALESLTPGGSEYVGDPERCVAHVQDHRDSTAKLLKKTIKDRKVLDVENAIYKCHLANALNHAKEVCPDYPWSASPTMSEIAWAICSTYEGVSEACDYWSARAENTENALAAWIEHEDTGPHDGCECVSCKGQRLFTFPGTEKG